MAISVVNASIEHIVATLEAVHQADQSISTAEAAYAKGCAASTSSNNNANNDNKNSNANNTNSAIAASAAASSSSSPSGLSHDAATALATAAAKVMTAVKKMQGLSAAYSRLEATLVDHNNRIASVVKAKHHDVSNYPNGKPMPFLCDYDIVPAKLLLGSLAGGYARAGVSVHQQHADGGDNAKPLPSSSSASSSSSAMALTQSMIAVGGPINGWAPLASRFMNFMELVAGVMPSVVPPSTVGSTAEAKAIFTGCDYSLFSTFTIPEILRFAVDGSADERVFAMVPDGSIGDSLRGIASLEQQAILKSQFEPLRKELECLEYNFGVAKTRCAREVQEHSQNAYSSEAGIRIAARRALALSRSLMLSTGCTLIDYHFRVGRVGDAMKYLSSLEGDLSSSPSGSNNSNNNKDSITAPVKPQEVAQVAGDASSVPPEARLSDAEFDLLSALRLPTMVAKIVIYHTFHTDYFARFSGRFIGHATRAMRDAIATPPARGGGGGGLGGGASASSNTVGGSGANAATAAAAALSGNERFVKAIGAYERLYLASRNASAQGGFGGLGVPMPFYGLPDVDPNPATFASSVVASAGGSASSASDYVPIRIGDLAIDGQHLLSDLNVPTAFNPFCAPLFSIADYTLLAVAEFYLPLCNVTVTNRQRLLLESSSFTSRHTIATRRDGLRSALGALKQFRAEDLTGARYDHVKTLMFGQYKDECEQLAKAQILEELSAQRSQQQQGNGDDGGGDNANAPSSPLTIAMIRPTYSVNTPVLAELARISAVLAISCLSREEQKRSYLALTEVQVLLSTEAGYVQDKTAELMRSFEEAERKKGGHSGDGGDDAVDVPNPFIFTSPQSSKRISTAARFVVQNCYNTHYSDAMTALASPSVPSALLCDFFCRHPLLPALINHCRQDIRESIISRLLQPYATLSMARMVDQLCLYSGPDPIGQLQDELRSMIEHNKLGHAIRIDWENKSVVKIQNSYGNAKNRQNNNRGQQQADGGDSSSSIYNYNRVDEAVLSVASNLESEVGTAFTRSAERLLRISSLRSTRLDDPPAEKKRVAGVDVEAVGAGISGMFRNFMN